MARHQFGPSSDTLVLDLEGNALVTTGTAWSARTGGTQYTDLQNLSGAALSGGVIPTSDGTDSLNKGQWAIFGPDGVVDIWVDFGTGKRSLVRSNNAGGGTGSGTVTSVNSVAPDGAGNVALAAANISDAVPSTRTVSAGTGLTGGGDLSANRTLTVDFAASGTSSATKAVRADDSRLSDARSTVSTSITDATAVGRSVLTAASTSAARTAIDAAATMAELNDVVFTSPAEGQQLYFDASLNIVNGAAQAPSQDASNITSGRFNAARNTLGVPIVVDYYLTLYGAANAWPSTRPGDANNPVEWRGPSSPGGSLLIAGDTFIKTA